MYVNLTEEFLKKHWESAKADAISEFGKDSEGDLLFSEIGADPEVEISENEITAYVDCDLGYISMTIPLSGEVLDSLVGIIIKRMNKMKSAMEALK